MKTGYVTTFLALQNALMIIVEYVCSDGHRIKCRLETIDWQTPWVIWC